jgi:hypothetical protein
MAKGYAMFRDAQGGTVYVNPDQVRYVQDRGDGANPEIFFDGAHCVAVNEPAGEVVRKIRTAS